MKLATSVIVVVLSWSSPAAVDVVADDADIRARIDRMLTEVYKSDEPGAAVLAMRDGRVLLREGYGMADLEWDIPVEPDMAFRLGSVTKQFTAAGILMLAQDGKLSLEDPLGKFLPDYPVSGRAVTIEQLLTHTSGIRSYTSIPGWQSRMRQDVTVQELIDLFKNQPMEFEPGAKWRYNNSGYVLLGAIIEEVSGLSYGDFIRRRIFEPLGMKHSYYGENAAIIPRRVPGYERNLGAYVNAPFLSMTQPYSAGALVSSVDDLELWDAALYDEKILDRQSIERMFRPYTLKNGTSTGYGCGWMIGEYEGLRTMEHGGGVNGFQSYVLRMPDRRVYVAILSNNASSELLPGMVAKRMAGLLIDKPLKDLSPIELSVEKLEEYVGTYRIDHTTTREVFRVGSRLFTQRNGSPRFEIFPVSESEFFYVGSFEKLTFVRDEAGRITHLMLDGNGPEEVAYREAPLLRPAPPGFSRP